jgi:hypothetical protein
MFSCPMMGGARIRAAWWAMREASLSSPSLLEAGREQHDRGERASVEAEKGRIGEERQVDDGRV